MAARRILVADDSATVRRLVRGVLEYRGYEVLEAPSGSEALAALAAQAPDLVILDLRMPDRDGLDILRHLREQERERAPAGPQTPVIILTAEEQEAEHALAAGASRFLVKPFRPVELVTLVGELLDSGGG